jgi:hypothetical protein
MEGLEGAGDGNGNGIVTFTEAYQYVSRMVSQATEGRQNPQVSGFGDIPLAVVGMAGAESQNGGR